MCGIVAIMSSTSVGDRVNCVNHMLESIAHRGPDSKGMYIKDGQGILAHNRLAIVDIENGKQPMVSSCQRYALVFNGEIYNYEELITELKLVGVEVSTRSDTEVLMQILIKFGESGISKLNGMFAFVFLDTKHNRWIAARDPFGIKPLYYSKVGDEFVIASEIKSLLKHPLIKSQRDDYSLAQYLTFQFCLDDKTLFSNIFKLMPGQFIYGTGSNVIKKITYWSPSYRIGNSSRTIEDYVENLLYLIGDSVKLQMRSDVSVGGYLSGGLDSSIICSTAADIHGSHFPMFHGRFDYGESYDESKYAKCISSHKHGTYIEITPSQNDFVDNIEALIYALDEPIAGPGVFPQFMVSKRASQTVKVVLGGQGGDEIFAGYARYLVGYLEQSIKGAIFQSNDEGTHLVTLESIIPNLPLLKEYTPMLKNFWKNGLFENMDNRYFRLINRGESISGLYNTDFKNSLDFESVFIDYQRIFNNPNTNSYINKMTNFDMHTLLPALLQIEDRVSMKVSIESRVPFLDKRIVDFATTMPPALKFRGGESKYIIKKAFYGLLPQTIINRKDKMGFPVPLKEWMRKGIVRDFVCDTLLSKCSVERGIYTKAALESMIEDSGVAARQLWGALSLEIWHTKFIDN